MAKETKENGKGFFLEKLSEFIFSAYFMGILLSLFAVVLAVATFIENDFGSGAARKAVYNARWFEILLLLLAVNLAGRGIIYKIYRKPKFTVFLFHIAFIVMLAGAAISRYTGYEGSIHIREGEEQNECYSLNKFIGFTIKDDNGEIIDDDFKEILITYRSSDKYKRKINVAGLDYLLTLERVIPNAGEEIIDDPGGVPLISLLVTDGSSMRTGIFLKSRETKIFGNMSIGFEPADSTDITIISKGDTFLLSSVYDITETSMKTRETASYKSGDPVILKEMQLLNIKGTRIVPQKLSKAGIINPVRVDPLKNETLQNAFIFSLSGNSAPAAVNVWERAGEEFSSGSVKLNGHTVEVFYGSKPFILPFSLKLNKFILERYPGSNSPSGYRSKVVLNDKKNSKEIPFEIFMNNILKYRGYRFYQSSYDKDEKGTILSVSHDPWGMIVTYTGYGLLFLFIILSLFNRNSLFRKAGAGNWKSALRKTAVVLIFLFTFTVDGNAQVNESGREASGKFGKVLVQDQKGRTKPLYTLSNDILRKVTRKNQLDGMSSMQVFLGIYFNFEKWKDVPLIKVSNKDVQRSLGLRRDVARFSELVDMNHGGSYKMAAAVEKAYSRSPGERDRTDKEVIKTDERVNIVYMLYTGNFLKIFPLNDDSHNWGSSDEALKTARSKEDSLFLQHIMPSVEKAVRDNDTRKAQQLTDLIVEYQKRFTEYKLPSKARVSAELLYYKSGIFERLFPYYALTGITLLITLLIRVIIGKKEKTILVRIPGILIFAGFLFHTAGLALRWYISGHAPLSNGYESMIFISWVTILAGFIFRKRSAFTLSATAVLASMTLMVAHLSFMDPEITNLVPVLKSYWLTLHVSVITGSYGFLGLGAVLGLITMILIAFSNGRNRIRISNTIDELVVINYKTLTVGLYLLTIGTFLGAVWANESWGRYWGWDPKETWSLITIVVYAFVIHSWMIKGMRNVYSFSLLSLFAFSSVLMTYFGVNYYLSGLHSYAGGDPVPVPAFVYVIVIVLAAVSYAAWIKYSRWNNLTAFINKPDKISGIQRNPEIL
jgi:cytochrome c-type biogenesis protein CcsB